MDGAFFVPGIFHMSGVESHANRKPSRADG